MPKRADSIQKWSLHCVRQTHQNSTIQNEQLFETINTVGGKNISDIAIADNGIFPFTLSLFRTRTHIAGRWFSFLFPISWPMVYFSWISI